MPRKTSVTAALTTALVGMTALAGWADTPYELDVPLGLDADFIEMQIPEDNPLTVERVELGKVLYFDPRLSVDNTVSCATCHSPAFGFSDGLPVSFGVQGKTGTRNAPVSINRAVDPFNTHQFWDGRAASLEEQAMGPIENPVEMVHSHAGAVARIGAIDGYKPLFKAAFGTEEVTIDRIVQAIAGFERTLLSGNSPLDRWRNGEGDAVSESAKRGFELFGGKANCGSCHAGFNFTDELFHNIGVGMNEENPDLGRYTVTKKDEDTGAFKTPTLRDVALSAPYMHDGSQRTLDEVIEFYDQGGHKNPHLDKEIKPLNLTDQEKQDLVAFLEALTGEPIVVRVPPLPQ